MTMTVEVLFSPPVLLSSCPLTLLSCCLCPRVRVPVLPYPVPLSLSSLPVSCPSLSPAVLPSCCPLYSRSRCPCLLLSCCPFSCPVPSHALTLSLRDHAHAHAYAHSPMIDPLSPSEPLRAYFYPSVVLTYYPACITAPRASQSLRA